MTSPVPLAINRHDFLSPTTNPTNDLNKIIERLGEVQQLGSANKAGARLRVGRAANEHIALLSQIMEGHNVRVDLTQGESLSVHFGGRRIHVPTFNERTMSVVQAGVRYAPIQHAVWDEGLKQTRVVSAQESLTHTLHGLISSGIKDMPIAEQASLIASSLEDFRNRGLLHLRFGPQAVGGAAPYYLSNQIALDASHPATRAAMEVERLIGKALETMHSNRVVDPKTGHLLSYAKGGVQESQSYVRQALAHQLAIGMMLFEEGSAIKSTGVKSLRLRGFDSFGGERAIGSEGRLIASTLPSWGYGVALPGEQLAKGLHHRRSLMALPVQSILQIRQEGARLRGLKGPKMRPTRLLMSAYDLQARKVASQQFGQMGVNLPGGLAQLDTPITGMFFRPRAGISAGDRGVAQELIFTLFGDSSALVTSPEMAQIAAEHGRFRTTRTVQLAHGKGSAAYATGDLHPMLAAAIERHGVGGPGTLETPITFEMLGGQVEERTRKTGSKYTKVTQKARIGGALTSLGESRASSDLFLGRDEVITGFRSGPGGTQVLIAKQGRIAMQEGTPALIGGKKRMSLGGAVNGFRGVDLIAPAGKMGLDISAPDVLFEHTAMLIERKVGKKGARDVAAIIGGKAGKGAFGQTEIHYGEQEIFPNLSHLFPAGPDGTKNLDALRRVIDVAEKYGIVLGPKSETERKALLEDIFEKGQVERIGELYRGQDISHGEAYLRARLGADADRLLRGRKISDYVEGVRVNTVAAIRAGQPSRGQFGRVAVRMRDLRMYAVGTAAQGGADILSMYRSNAVVKKSFGLTGAEADGAARAMRRYGMMWRNHVEAPMGLESYIEAHVAAAEGRVAGLNTEQFEVISHAEYRKRFGSGVKSLPRRATLEDLRGTPFVEEVDGVLRPTTKTLVVEMPEKGFLSLRRMGRGRKGQSWDVRAAEVQHVIVPSGDTLGLRAGEHANFSKIDGRGLKSSFGRQAVKLHGELTGGDAITAYKFGGATALTGAEHYFGRGGARHRGPGRGVRASFSGTLVSDATIEVGEVGVSRKTAREMLRRQGWKGRDLTAKLKSVESGESEFFTHFKTEPMRAPEHLTAARVKILPGRNVRKGVGGEIVTHADEAIHVNPLGLLIRERDFDYDPGYLFNMAHSTSRQQLKAFSTEQQALKILWEKNRAEHKAIAEVAQQIVASTSSKGAAEKLSTRSAEMIADARKIAAQFMGREVRDGAHTVEYALAQTMAATPELLTPIGNVRHRTRMQILEDIAMGRNIDSMIMRNQENAGKEALQTAMGTLRGDLPALSWLHTAAKASEYTVLKKAHAEHALTGMAAGSPDTFFGALAADLRIGQAVPGTEAAETEVGHIMGPLMQVLGLGEGGSSQVISKAHGMTQEQLARRMALSYQAAAFAERQGVMSSWQGFLTDPSTAGTAIRGPDGFIGQFLKFLEGRDPEFAGRVISGGHNWGAIQAGASTAARQAGDEAVAAGGHVIGGFAKNFAAGGKGLLKGLWESKWGKWGLGAAGLIAAISAGQGLFGGGGGGSAPPGVPMPPPPMLGDPGPERMLDYTGIPQYGEARIQRVPQIRTHYQVSMEGTSHMDFRGIANQTLGAFGRRPMHSGAFIDSSSPRMHRQRIEQEVHDHMNSDF